MCIDVLHPRGGSETEIWGGIANAVAALGGLAGKSDAVIPVCSVSPDDRERFLKWLERFPAVDSGGVFSPGGPTNRIHIFEQENGVRTACAKDIAPPIPFDRIKRFLGVNGILISMASGFDVTLETVDLLRMEIRQEAIPVHFDFHNLTMGVNPRGERFRRPLADWRRWAFMIDPVLLNEEEIAGLGVNRMSEQDTAGQLLTLGGKGVSVTRGARGATLYTNERKKIVRRDIPVEAVSGEPDTTGLGDIFGAAFLYRCVASASLVDAVTFAGAAASAAAARPRGER